RSSSPFPPRERHSMSNSRLPLCLLILTLLSTSLIPTTTDAQATTSPYKAETVRWRAADTRFASWQRDAVILLPDGTLQLDPHNAHPSTDLYRPGTYKGGNFYNGSAF